MDNKDPSYKKVCNKCNEEKAAIFFSKDSKAKDGRKNTCKTCKRAMDIIRNKNPEIKAIRREDCRRYRKNNPDRVRELKRASSKKESTVKTAKEWEAKNKENRSIQRRLNYENNRAKRQQSRRAVYPQIKDNISKHNKERYRLDENYRISRILRARITAGLNSQHSEKTCSSELLIGCTFAEYKDYIESKFTSGMSWENQGLRGWHIDHIVPICSFDLRNPEEQKKAFHYTNCQPLWAEDNLKKGKGLSEPLY